MAYDPTLDIGLQNGIPPIPASALYAGMPMNSAAAFPTPQPQQQNSANPMLNEILAQYSADKQPQNNGGGIIQQILSNRMQPSMQDVAQSINNTASSFGAPDQFKAQSPDQIMSDRVSSQLAPYAKASELALQGAQTNSLNDQVNRQLAVLKYQYANNPEMAMARAMANYVGGFNGQPSAANGKQANGQPNFNPMGAMLAKQFGLENMQIGNGGQPELIPGVVSPGQKEQDTNFAQSYQTYANAGGAKRAQNALDVVQKTIDDLKANKLTTGGLLDRMSMTPAGEPSYTGQLLNPSVLVARNQIANSILPQAKALFGARVTNFDAQSLINSQGLDPLADTQTNIDKLERLKSALLSGRNDLETSGKYFITHGTLSGYQPQIQQPSVGRITVTSPTGQSGTIDPSELQDAIKNGWKQVQ